MYSERGLEMTGILHSKIGQMTLYSYELRKQHIKFLFGTVGYSTQPVEVENWLNSKKMYRNS